MMAKNQRGILVAALLLQWVWSLMAQPNGKTVLGFHPEGARTLLRLESSYDSFLSPQRLRRWMKQMTSRPHHAGSPKAKANAQYIASLFRSWGYDTEIETFYVLFPTPKTRELEQLEPSPVSLSLTEKIIASDSAAQALRDEALPPYNAYSADGEAVAPLVYVNRGVPEDYEVLERHGIDVKGKIALARYGGSWRGIKPKVAHEKGAIGCIIFNDPADDGYAKGAPYPQGAFKHATAVQRGSVVDLPLRPGDPLTPNVGATRDARRLSRQEAETLMKIPVLPISSADAEILLRNLDGPVAPDEWRGALPVTYRLGGGSPVVRLKVESNWNQIPAYDVIARLEGSEFPGEWILRGNHHDAWVIGARDPMSGLVPLLEQARAFAQLKKTSGWRPKRTVLFCVWDAEEPGLLGSVEWLERHGPELREHAVAYLNTDGNSRGFLNIGGAHALETLAGQVAQRVTDPQTGVSVSERLRAHRLVDGTPRQKELAATRDRLYLNALGSGSDYTGFLQHLGIASFNISFGGEGRGGEYHTCFDTFDHFTRFIDPGFQYGIALAKVCGRLTLRLADADILPFDFAAAVETFGRYRDEVVRLTESMRTETEEANRWIRKGYPRLAADPARTFVPPRPKPAVPFLNFAPLQNALAALKKTSASYSKTLNRYLESDRSLPAAKRKALNRLLQRSEQALLNPDGLPRRPWFRHVIYAPGFYTGYGVKTFPGVREGIEERDWSTAQTQIQLLSEAMERYQAILQQAIDLLQSAAGPA